MGNLHLELTRSLRECLALCDYLRKRLLDAEDCNIDKFDSGSIGSLRTGNLDHVTYLNTKAGEVLLCTVSVESTIDVHLACAIVEIPVAIGSFGNSGTYALYLIGLSVRTVYHVLAGCGYSLKRTLTDPDELPVVTANKSKFELTAAACSLG